MEYYTLIASLPALPPHFDVDRTPMARPRLRQLLKQLTEEDAETIQQLASFFSWDRQLIDRSDEEICRRYDELMQNQQPVIRDIVNLRINVRTIIAAVRRRRDGLDPPRAVGEMVRNIQRNWNDPTFGLGQRFPWVEQFAQHMLAGDTDKAERAIFEFSWKTWSRMAAEFAFSFEAVPLYVARWEILSRWTNRDRDTGKQRFEKLMKETLGEYAALQF